MSCHFGPGGSLVCPAGSKYNPKTNTSSFDTTAGQNVGHTTTKNKPIKHSSNFGLGSPTPSKHSNSTPAGGCFAAGGTKILSASQCKAMGIPPGGEQQPPLTCSPGFHVKGTGCVSDKTGLPTPAGGCFGPGGTILTPSQCMQQGIPLGTEAPFQVGMMMGMMGGGAVSPFVTKAVAGQLAGRSEQIATVVQTHAKEQFQQIAEIVGRNRIMQPATRLVAGLNRLSPGTRQIITKGGQFALEKVAGGGFGLGAGDIPNILGKAANVAGKIPAGATNLLDTATAPVLSLPGSINAAEMAGWKVRQG